MVRAPRVIERVDHIEAGYVADRKRIDYRFLVRSPDGLFLVEQRAYFDVDGASRIAYMRAICSGYRPLADQEED